MRLSDPVPTLREEAIAIWRAGVDAVDSTRLVSRQITSWRGGLKIANVLWRAQPQSRICVVGGGKAGAGMTEGVWQALGNQWGDRLLGWVNVPADCVEPQMAPLTARAASIHLHPARPAGVNEPTVDGVQGTREILELVSGLNQQDLCLVLISGGGSALLPAPRPGISLADKQAVTRLLMRGGATIQELNTVRSALSALKGGGLLRACRAGLLVSLIISDVIGDPLETIASGPTVDRPFEPDRAREILMRFADPGDSGSGVSESVWTFLESPVPSTDGEQRPLCRHENRVIGKNQTAVEAAAHEARRRGFQIQGAVWDQAGIAADCGRQLANDLQGLLANSSAGSRQCLISGGEPTVRLTPASGSQQGGRNQELVLAAVETWLSAEMPPAEGEVVLLSGGTDGEDGPTDAAGAIADRALLERVREQRLDASDALLRHDSYPFLEAAGGLLKTGPTHTNVMDLRVGLTAKRVGGSATK